MSQQLEEALARANESAFAAEVANFELNQIFNNATDGMCTAPSMGEAFFAYAHMPADTCEGFSGTADFVERSGGRD